MEIIYQIGLGVLGLLMLALFIHQIIKIAKRNKIRRQNRACQFEGSPIKEERGFWTPRFGSRAEEIGELGEKHLSWFLADLPPEDYMVFNDLLVINGGHTTQVDHVIISRYGIFVLEMKNFHGKVYGNGNAEFWKQYLPDVGYKRYGFTQEHQLRNPLWQNAGHIKTLRRLAFGDDVQIYGLVVFPGETEVHVNAEQPIIPNWNVVSYIQQFKDPVLTHEQMRFYRRRLLEVISTREADRKKHLDNVHRQKERRDTMVDKGLCPLCGGKLVLRNGKYGQFYGCSNYPKCTFILNK